MPDFDPNAIIPVAHVPESATGRSAIGARPIMVGPGTGSTVTNIFDREDRQLPFNQVILGANLTPEQKSQLQTIYDKARDIPQPNSGDSRLTSARDRGQDLKKLLPLLLEKNGELLQQMFELATSDRLFLETLPADATAEKVADFERRRADYMVDVLCNAANVKKLGQGPGMTCTPAAQLKHLVKKIGPAEYIRIATDYGSQGEVTIESTKVMKSRPEYHERSIANSKANLEDIKSVRTSAGSQNLLYAIMDLEIPEGTPQSGSFWWQYTGGLRHLTGHEVACAAPTGEVLLDGNGRAVRTEGQSVSKATAFSYMVSNLRRNEETASFLIDTEWSHAGAYSGAQGEHGRHMLQGTGAVTRCGADGVTAEYLVCDNPIGKYVDRSTGSFYPAGTVLGEKNGFWFETGADGTVYIRMDVAERNLKTIAIEYEDTYVYDPAVSNAVKAIGELDREEIIWVRGDARDAEERQKAPEVRVTERRGASGALPGAAVVESSHKGTRQNAPAPAATRRVKDGRWLEGDIPGYVTEFETFSREPRSAPKVAAEEVAWIERLQKKEEVVYRQSAFDNPPPGSGVEGNRLTAAARNWGSSPAGNYMPVKKG